MDSTNNIDSVVLDLIKEYLSKKTFFSIKDLIDYINNRVKMNPYINRNRIELVIKSLIKKKEIIPGTKLMKNNIIDNQTRKKIFNYIKKNPAININEIMKHQEIGSNQALWHLSALEKFQFIRSKKIGNRRIFFIIGSNPEFDDIYYYLKMEIVNEIIKFMDKNKKALKITDIADGLKKNHNVIKKYLNILDELNLLEIEKEKSRDTYKIDQERYSEVIKLVSKK
ncbi:MAG: winged helix-turn-helix transcriptional regulator [Promethearchaeota archaeon]